MQLDNQPEQKSTSEPIFCCTASITASHQHQSWLETTTKTRSHLAQSGQGWWPESSEISVLPWSSGRQL